MRDVIEKAHGVLRVTVFEGFNVLSERVIFCDPPKQNQKLSIKLNEGKTDTFAVGEEINLSLSLENETANCLIGVSVVDESVLEMVSRRKQVPRLPVMVYLESECKGLDDAKVYLDKSDPSSSFAIDLLLGIQGWRRCKNNRVF